MAAIIASHGCSGCHGGGIFNLSATALYKTLTTPLAQGNGCAGDILADPQEATLTTSVLLDKLSASPKLCTSGGHMPETGNSVTMAQLQTILSWIEAGAKND